MEQNPKPKNAHANHRARMKARVRRDGLDGLAEHEALEYLLFFAIPRKDTNELAHRLIDHFGSFCKVLEASEEELQKVEGIGPASAELIHAVLPFCRYYQRQSRGPVTSLRRVEKSIEYALLLDWSLQDERVYLILMNDTFFPLRTVLLGEGTPNQVQINRTKALREAARSSATCAILVHNHPGGFARPSGADLQATDNMKLVLANIGVELVDHIVVAGGEACSLRQMGRMP